MNPFAELLNDTVYIQNISGDRTGPFKTAIGSKNGLSATIFDESLDVEEGWAVLRPLPNGKEESYTVLEANYSPGLHSIQPHWTLKLKKDSSLINRQPAHKKTTINISNSNGIQVGDNNVLNIESGLNELIQQIKSSNTSGAEKKQAMGTVKTLINNPIVASVLGSATSGLLSLLG